MSRVYRMGRKVKSAASHDAVPENERPIGVARREWAKVLRRRALLARARSMVDLSAGGIGVVDPDAEPQHERSEVVGRGHNAMQVNDFPRGPEKRY